MSQSKRPTGHLQVKIDKNGRTRSFWAFWRDRDDRKGGRRLGPAHVRDSGRRTARGAIIWRAGHGPKPSPEYLTPKEAQACLETILHELRTAAEMERGPEHTLQQAVEGWLTERNGEWGLKRSTIAGYEDMFERLFRDLGADTPVRSLADGRLRAYFADFKSYRVLSEKKAREARAEGKNVQQLTIERWTAEPEDSQAVEVATKEEAVRLADELPGTWKHRRRGVYRVVPLDAQRPRRVSRATAMALQTEGWIVTRRTTALDARALLVLECAGQVSGALGNFLTNHEHGVQQARSTFAATPHRAARKLAAEREGLPAMAATLARTSERVDRLVADIRALGKRVRTGTRRQTDDHTRDYGRALDRLLREARAGVGRRAARASEFVSHEGVQLTERSRRRLGDAQRDIKHAGALIAAHDFRPRGWLLAALHDGTPVRSTADLRPGRRIDLHLHDGHASTVIETINPDTGSNTT